MSCWHCPLRSYRVCRPGCISSPSSASRSKAALSPSPHMRQTAFLPGKVAFSGSEDSFILEMPLISVSLQTNPKAGCFLQVTMLVPTAQTSISLLSFSIAMSRSSLRSSEARIRSLCSGTYLFQICLQSLESWQRSPESNLMPMLVMPAWIRAFPTRMVFSIPDQRELYVSMRDLKLLGKVFANPRKAANYPS